MNGSLIEGWRSLLKLVKFLFWYAFAMVALIYALPWLGRELERFYDAMSSTSRLFSIAAFFIVIIAWQVIGWRAYANQDRRRHTESR
jgi:hypothetical protein